MKRGEVVNNSKNLIPNDQRTPSELREMTQKGGIASGVVRRKKRDMRESMRKILELPISEQQTADLATLGIDGTGWTLADVMNIMAVQQALKGNVSAMGFVRDTAGYNPELALREEQFAFEKERKTGQGAEIEDMSSVVADIWSYDVWMRMLADGIPVILIRQVIYKFSEKHIEYIRKCEANTYNILEGAVRSGKTVDHILAFAKELCDTPDKFHLATGSTMANAKLNIGDANGFGLEHIFRGQCRWGSYRDNDALIIRGPFTNFEEKIVIFCGAGSSVSYRKFRGNSYGIWIATEINLHHDNSIKEAFNRTVAAKRRKFFWDLNPCHPKDPIYTNYIDKYAAKAKAGELIGGYNYAHFNIFDNVNITEERLAEIVSQYDKGSIWYIRDIEGKRSIAEGLIYVKLAASIAADDKKYLLPVDDAQKAANEGKFKEINIGVDFGGNGSGHAFAASAPMVGYEKLVLLRTERHLGDDIDPDKLGKLFVDFVKKVKKTYGFVTNVYCDSAEQVLMRGLQTALNKAKMGDIKCKNASKKQITDRIFCLTSLVAQDRFLFTEDCKTFVEAVSMAVWNPKNIDLERLDDGTSDIDTMDATEYSFERDIRHYIKQIKEGK